MFVQGDKLLKSMMKQTKVTLEMEGLGIVLTSKEKALKYDGKCDILYEFAMPWKIYHKCRKKDHLEKKSKFKRS